jgi:hypothetical protein
MLSPALLLECAHRSIHLADESLTRSETLLVSLIPDHVPKVSLSHSRLPA